MKPLFSFFIRRPLLVNLTMVFVILAGLFVARSQEYSSYPAMDLGVFSVVSPRPGASAEDVELSVTVPLEEEIIKIDGLDKLLSSSMEGMSSILVETNPDNTPAQNREFRNDLQQALDKAESRLPDDMPFKPEIVQHDPDALPVMELLLHGNVSEEVLRRTARQLKTDLLQIKGVSGVGKEGFRDKEVKILLDPQRLHQLGIAFDEIINAIHGRNVRDSGGSLSSFVSEKDIVTVGEFRDPRELADVIIRTGGAANYVRIRDIGEVVVDYEDWTIQSLTDGRPGINLLVRKEADADGFTVTGLLVDYVERVQGDLPPGVALSTFNDSTRYARSMLNTLLDNAFAGIILVFFVLLAFFPMNFTIWVVIGIPTAILISFIFMPGLGITMDQLSIGALILMLGILVDDAIVISESIYQRTEMGDSPIDAAINGTHSIAAPVITSAATTILAFTPLLFLSGEEGKFMWVIPAMAMLVLTASLIEGGLMLPAHIAHALKAAEGKPDHARTWYRPVIEGYRRWLAWVLGHRYQAFVGATLAVILVAMVCINQLKVNLYPDGDIDNFFVKVELPVGSSFEQTRASLSELEYEIRNLIHEGDLLNIKTTLGHHNGGIQAGLDEGQQTSWGVMSVFLVELDERQSDAMTLIQELRDTFEDRPGFRRIVIEPYRNTPPVGRAVEVDVVGNDEDRYLVADMLINFLQQHPSVDQVWSSYSPGKDIIELKMNHEAIADYGLRVADITRAVRIAFDGQLIDELQTVEERIKFRLQFKKPEQGSLETLYGLSIVNAKGDRILLRNLVELVTKPGEASIRHYFGRRTVTVYAEIDKDTISVAEINRQLSAFMEDENIRQHYAQLQINQGGELQRQQQAMGSIGSAAIMSLAGILFLLVLLFNSMTQPVLVMMVIPLGIVGVLLAFTLHGFDLSMSAAIGMTGLTGILVNDSLILIDRLNRARTGGFLSEEEVVSNAATRLRPIFITTVTTVAALFPSAYGLLGANPFLQPMIMAMFWGVMFGSLITLFYLPCLYVIEQDLRRWVASKRSLARS